MEVNAIKIIDHKLRENICALIIGMRRNGKSTYIVDELIPIYLANVANVTDVYVIQGKRNDTYDKLKGKKHFHLHLLNDIKESMPILKNLSNAVVFFDDAQLLIGKQLDDNVRKMIINLGQCNVDLFLVFHSFTAATRELWTLIDMMEIFYVQESAAARSEFLTTAQIKEIDDTVKKLKKFQHASFER